MEGACNKANACGTVGNKPARTLSQSEIDNLMGFGGSSSATAQQSGLRQVVSAGLVSYERLPMLEVIFDRLVRVLSSSLRNLTSDTVEHGLFGRGRAVGWPEKRQRDTAVSGKDRQPAQARCRSDRRQAVDPGLSGMNLRVHVT